MNLRLRFLVGLLILLAGLPGRAVTYVSSSTTFAWIDASTHTKVGYNTAPYKFNGGGGCGTNPPVLDDTISDLIPLETRGGYPTFTFMFGGVNFTSVRIMANGRLQFGNSTCGYGTASIGPPQTYPYAYPDASLTYTMKMFGVDLDPTRLSDSPTYPTNCANGTTCYVSFATVGEAPNRSFVVTWNNVPEWINYTRTAGNFNIQAILQENGEFVFQYGSNVHGGTGTGEVGWEIDTGDYDVLRFPGGSEPDPNTAVKFSYPEPIAEYRMEQPDWSAYPVRDTSGHGRHGTAVGIGGATPPTTTAAGKVCRGGSIVDNNSVAQISAIDSGINVPTDVGSVGTATFWVYGVSQDRMLFDASTILNAAASPVTGAWFYAMRTTNGAVRFVVSDEAGTRYVAETANNMIAAGSWAHVAITWNFNAKTGANQDRIRVWVNGVLRTTNAFTTASPLASAISTLYIGDNRNTNAIDTNANGGTGRSAGTTLDEFRLYNVEAGLGLVLRDMNQAGACLGHYAVVHGGSGTTCAPTQVTIRAHDAAHANVIMPNNTTSIRLTTSTGRGDWSLVTGYGTLNNGSADDGIATYLFNGEYQAVFALTHAVSGTVNINVTDGQIGETAAEDPNLTIAACSGVSGFDACEATPTRCTPGTGGYANLLTKLAGQAFNLDLVALKADGTLETAFTNDVVVDLLANVSNGVALGTNRCPVGQTAVIALGTLTFGSETLPVTPAGGRRQVQVGATAFSSVSPNYSAYRDVRVRFTCSPPHCASAITACSADNFAVRPQGLAVSSTMNNTSSLSGTPRAVAGTDFQMTATAVPGYNGSPVVERLTGVRVQSCWGSASGCPAAQNTDRLYDISVGSQARFGAAAPSTGATSASTFQYHEAGTFVLPAGAVYDADFAQADSPRDCVAGSWSNADDDGNAANGVKVGCQVATQVNQGPFGRFYPDHYESVSGSVTPTCGSFSYLGQPGFGVSFQARAMSIANPTSLLTTRYDRGTVTIVAGDGATATNLYGGAITLSPAITGSWSGGTYTGAATGATITRPAAAAGPYDSLYFAYNVADAVDTGIALTGRDFNLGNPTCASGCGYKKVAAATSVRFGRLALYGGYGSELRPLLIPIEAQYWNGSAFVRNAADACTAVPASAIALAPASGVATVAGVSAMAGGRAAITLNPVA
ncbi:MAG TPA: hypothetical protein PK375_04190, partial [Rhodocyclaceae bacterium]|nr:hypothetical protein [Rhodocyclaceae bacterium]